MKMMLFMAAAAVALQKCWQAGQEDEAVDNGDIGIISSIIARAAMSFYLFETNFWAGLDAMLFDIPWEEEHQQLHWSPRRYRRIADFFDDDEARCCTRFTVDELRILNDLFGLPNVVRIPAGRQRGPHAHCYEFTKEELLIYTLMKQALGETHTGLCDSRIGGDSRRWSAGYRWFLLYLNRRYDNILAANSIYRWVHLFPEFADAIERKCGLQRTFTDSNGIQHEIPGVLWPPGTFPYVGFVDCSMFKTYTPGTGPIGDYIDAPRRPDCYDIQRTVYSGYKKFHGIKVLTVLFPNGITACVFGPTSARHNDLGVWNLSQLNDTMYEAQHAHPALAGRVYKLFSDGGFPVRQDCLDHGYPPTGPLQVVENYHLNVCRVSIEWSYGILSNLIRICNRFDAFRLFCERPYAYEQLRVSYLLMNCYACFHGNQVSSINQFGLKPPSIEEYLVH